MTRYEKTIYESHGFSRTTRGKLAGLCRLTRMNCPYSDFHRKTIWETTADVSAPLLIDYVKWCMDKAGRMGFNRLYFMARDGQIMYKLALILNRRLNYDMSFRYLYASRQALLPPSVVDIDSVDLFWILRQTNILTLEMIFNRVNVSLDKIEGILEGYGFQSSTFKKPLNKRVRKKLPHFFENEDIRRFVREKAASRRADVFGYLEQEGLTADGKFALVDIGWNGTLQRSVSKILDAEGLHYPVHGLYFDLKSRKKYKDQDALHAYLQDGTNGGYADAYTVPIMELFAAADHGGVVGYENRDGRWGRY